MREKVEPGASKEPYPEIIRYQSIECMTNLGQCSEAFPKVSDFRKVHHPKMLNCPNFVMHSNQLFENRITWSPFNPLTPHPNHFVPFPYQGHIQLRNHPGQNTAFNVLFPSTKNVFPACFQVNNLESGIVHPQGIVQAGT